MADNPLSDALFPVGATLRKVASGDIFDSSTTGADNAASATAMRRARSNPSGIDMAAEAQKAAARAKAAKPALARPKAPAAPTATPASNSRDHYSPRSSSFTGTILNND